MESYFLRLLFERLRPMNERNTERRRDGESVAILAQDAPCPGLAWMRRALGAAPHRHERCRRGCAGRPPGMLRRCGCGRQGRRHGCTTPGTRVAVACVAAAAPARPLAQWPGARGRRGSADGWALARRPPLWEVLFFAGHGFGDLLEVVGDWAGQRRAAGGGPARVASLPGGGSFLGFLVHAGLGVARATLVQAARPPGLGIRGATERLMPYAKGRRAAGHGVAVAVAAVATRQGGLLGEETAAWPSNGRRAHRWHS